MKAAKLYNFSDIRIEDIPIPVVGPDDLLLRTKACGICSGDVMPWYIEKKAPLVPGHEFCGEVADAGRNITAYRPGDRLFVHHHAPCMQCRFCRRGDYVQCPDWKAPRIEPGGAAEYILIPSMHNHGDVLVLSDDVTFEDGTFIEPVACVVKGFRRAGIKQGDTVLIIGLGVMGMIHLLLAREYGAGRVIGADRIGFRLKKAQELGADQVLDVSRGSLPELLKEATGGDMAEMVVVGPNSADVMMQGIHCVRPGGQVLFFTPARPGERLAVDPNHVYFRDINIITSYSCGPPDTRKAHEYIKKGVVTAEKLVTHRFPIERTAEAFRLTADAGESLKALIVFE